MGSAGISSVPAFSVLGAARGSDPSRPPEGCGTGHPMETPPRLPKRCSGAPSKSPGRTRALGELPPASLGTTRTPQVGDEVRGPAHVRKINGMEKIQNKHSPPPQKPPPEGCSPGTPAAHTPFFPTFSRLPAEPASPYRLIPC